MMMRIRREMLRPYSIYIASPTIAWVAAAVIATASVNSADAQQAAKGEVEDSQAVLTEEDRAILESILKDIQAKPGGTPTPGTPAADRPCAQRKGVLQFNPNIPCSKRLVHRPAKLREAVCEDPTLAHLGRARRARAQGPARKAQAAGGRRGDQRSHPRCGRGSRRRARSAGSRARR